MLWCKRCNREMTDAPLKERCVNCGDYPICEYCSDFLIPDEAAFGRVCIEPCWTHLADAALDDAGEFILTDDVAKKVISAAAKCLDGQYPNMKTW